jgi:MarR family transcriptional regulator for hemolysin
MLLLVRGKAVERTLDIESLDIKESVGIVTSMARRPATPPLGLALARTARVVTTAFDRALADAGGSAAIWQVLLLVRTGEWGTQSRMADAMGVTAATLTHHLNALEAQGLVRRRRDEGNRRVQRVELTDEGAALFDRLRRVAMRHDERLRSQLTVEEAAALVDLLEKVAAGVAGPPAGRAGTSRRGVAGAPPG